MSVTACGFQPQFPSYNITGVLQIHASLLVAKWWKQPPAKHKTYNWIPKMPQPSKTKSCSFPGAILKTLMPPSISPSIHLLDLICCLCVLILQLGAGIQLCLWSLNTKAEHRSSNDSCSPSYLLQHPFWSILPAQHHLRPWENRSLLQTRCTGRREMWK